MPRPSETCWHAQHSRAEAKGLIGGKLFTSRNYPSVAVLATDRLRTRSATSYQNFIKPAILKAGCNPSVSAKTARRMGGTLDGDDQL
jgi:hypothetical protein